MNFSVYFNNLEINKELYDDLFSVNIDLNKPIEVKDIQSDDEYKFYFFFNKRKYKNLTMSSCQIRFPRVNFNLLVLYGILS